MYKGVGVESTSPPRAALYIRRLNNNILCFTPTLSPKDKCVKYCMERHREKTETMTTQNVAAIVTYMTRKLFRLACRLLGKYERIERSFMVCKTNVRKKRPMSRPQKQINR